MEFEGGSPFFQSKFTFLHPIFAWMFRERLRVILSVCLFLALFCTAGWLLPSHFCRIESCMDCQPVESCCEKKAPAILESAEDACCFDVSGYYNFPVFFVTVSPIATELPVLIREFAGFRSSNQITNSFSLFAPAKPPDIVLSGSSISPVLSVFRI